MTHKPHGVQKIPKIMGVCPHTSLDMKGFRHGGGNIVPTPFGKIENSYCSQIPPQQRFNVCPQVCGAFDTLSMAHRGKSIRSVYVQKCSAAFFSSRQWATTLLTAEITQP